MTDNEIIKALWCCSKGDVNYEQCPANGLCDTDDYCFTGAILDLINRQKAEIEMLNKTLVFEINSAFERGKAEAHKEFAERLCEDRVANDPVVIAARRLLKELEGEQ